MRQALILVSKPDKDKTVQVGYITEPISTMKLNPKMYKDNYTT